MKDGQYRVFRSSGESIKEVNDWSYKFFFDNLFFDSLWRDYEKNK